MYRTLSRNAVSTWGSRFYHIWYLGKKYLQPVLTPSCLEKDEFQKEAQVAVGCGFCAVYIPGRSSAVHIYGHDSACFGFYSHNTGLPCCSKTSLSLPDDYNCKIHQVACGREHAVVLTTDGQVLTAGRNSLGQCCSPVKSRSGSFCLTPLLPRLNHRVKQVAAGLDHCLLLTEEGQVYSYGWSADGQTGTGCFDLVCDARSVIQELSQHRVKSVNTCADSCSATTREGEIFTWGNNEYGQLLLRETENKQVAVPNRVTLPSVMGQICSIVMGATFSAIQTDSGSVYYAGYGLGKGAKECFPSDQLSLLRQLQFFPTATPYKQSILKAGLHFLTLQTSRRDICLWGSYSSEHLLLLPLPHLTPHKITFPADVIHYSCGPDALVALLDVE